MHRQPSFTFIMKGLILTTLLAARVTAKPFALPQDPSLSTTTGQIITSTSTTSSPVTSSTSSDLNPCAQISQIYTNGTDYNPRVPAELAYDCLNDVPLDSANAGTWVETLRPYLEWQSTTAYLKDPPEGYLEPAVDVWAGYEDLVSGVANGKFANEYELGLAIYRLFQTTHDGHFRYLPLIIGSIFGFGRPVSLISYSADGTEAPKPYVYTDVLSQFVNGTSPPSAVTQIDGQNAVEFLENWAQYGSLQDPDALYNNVFYELAQATLGSTGSGAGTFAGAGRGAFIYPGPTTTLTFENGTTTVLENFARVLVPFRNIYNGQDLYGRYVNPYGVHINSTVNPINNMGSTANAAVSTSAPTATNPAGYPSPIVRSNLNYVAGYYLDEPGYEDVAVLAVTSFVGIPDYQDVVYSFLEQASQAGKTRLVIDTSANGGGTIMQGYNMFLNLFPDILPYGATRFRSHEAFNIIGETVSERIFEYPFDYNNPPNRVWQDFAAGTPFNYRVDVDIDYKNFESWEDKYGPNTFMGDNFTNIIRWNLSDPTIAPSNDIQPNGFGNRTGLPPSRPFDPENIVILYDGYCASTCAIFSEFMTEQVGVKTVSIGGRPNNQPMQTVGGVKGTNNYPWTYISQLVSDMYVLAPDQAGYFNSTSLYSYIDPDASEIVFSRAVGNSGQVNVRDGIRQGDDSQTPLQFIYEAAACRLYYTAEMTVDVTAIWEKVIDVAFQGDKCAVGGFSERTPRSTVAISASDKAQRRFEKRMKQMTSHKASAIESTLDVFTDFESIEPRQGLMLP